MSKIFSCDCINYVSAWRCLIGKDVQCLTNYCVFVLRIEYEKHLFLLFPKSVECWGRVALCPWVIQCLLQQYFFFFRFYIITNWHCCQPFCGAFASVGTIPYGAHINIIIYHLWFCIMHLVGMEKLITPSVNSYNWSSRPWYVCNLPAWHYHFHTLICFLIHKENTINPYLCFIENFANRYELIMFYTIIGWKMENQRKNGLIAEPNKIIWSET